ncbi:MAG TPA: IPT/TIG domain-containing protein [Bryobacteraceae bacterium]
MRLALLCAVVCPLVFASGPGPASFTITTAAGGTFCGDGRAATAAYLGAPEGLAADRQGNLYISDATDHRVRKVDASGIVTTIAGNGYKGFRGDGGPATAAELDSPYGLAVDAAGNVYVADLGNGRVRKISPDGIIETVAGGTAQNGFVLNQPRNLALDASGNLYISDFAAHRVYRLTTAGAMERFAGIDEAGNLLDGDELRADVAPLRSPAGLVVDRRGALYIADSGNARIRKIQDGVMSTVVTPGRELLLPTGIALDSQGVLYVADKRAAVVFRIAPQGPLVAAGDGTPGYEGDGGAAALARLTEPREVAVDAAGNLYIADVTPREPSPVGMVRRVSASGIIDTAAGGLDFRPPGDWGVPGEAHLERPTAVAVGSDGALYIADGGARRVRKVAAGVISTLAQDSELLEPAGLAVGPTGVRISDAASHRVWLAAASGALSGVAGIEGPGANGYAGDGDAAIAARLDSPRGLALDAAGNLYIADTGNHAIREVLAGGAIITIAGTGAEGNAGDGGAAYAARLRGPAGIALDTAGNLYIADTGNHRVRRIDLLGRIATVAGDGTAGFGGDAGTALAAQLRAPEAVAVDGAGNLYIADTGNHRIRRVTGDGIIRTVAGIGTPGFGGDGGAALAAQLNEPAGLAFDGAGNLLIADRGNGRVRKLAPSTAPAPAMEWDCVNAASRLSGPVAPGELVSILGTDLGPSDPVAGRVLDSGRLATSLEGTEVWIGGTPAPLLSVGYQSIVAQVPYEVPGNDSVEVLVRRGGAAKMRLFTAVQETAPALFTVEGGAGQASATNEDGGLNSSERPAAAGSVVTLFATGEGATSPESVTGKPAVAPYPVPVHVYAVKIGGRAAQVLFVGSAPGYVGLLQINVRIPKETAPGVESVELKVGSAVSQPGVTIVTR